MYPVSRLLAANSLANCLPSALAELTLQGNPLMWPPPDVIQSGLNAIMACLRDERRRSTFADYVPAAARALAQSAGEPAARELFASDASVSTAEAERSRPVEKSGALCDMCMTMHTATD